MVREVTQAGGLKFYSRSQAGGTWLAQSGQQVTLDLWVMSLEPRAGYRDYTNK